LATWEMPDSLIEVASHHELEGSDRPGGKLIDYVDAANFLVGRIKAGTIDEAECNYDDSPAIGRLGMTAATLMSVEMEIEEAASELQVAMST